MEQSPGSIPSIRKCSFCKVPKKEGYIKQVSNVDDIVQHKKVKFLDNNFLMIRRDEKSLHSPLSVVFYDFYNSEAEIEQTLTLLQEEIQCVASTMNLNFPRRVELGKTQGPKLWDYADGIDTLKFLKSLQFEASTVSQ